MGTILSCCLGQFDNGQHKNTNRLLDTAAEALEDSMSDMLNTQTTEVQRKASTMNDRIKGHVSP